MDSQVVVLKREKKPKQPKRARKAIFFTSMGDGDMILKRLTIGGIKMNSGVGGTLLGGTETAQVQTVPAFGWSSYAARFQQYRVRAIRITGKALLPVNANNGSVIVLHDALYRADYSSGAVPVSPAQVLADEKSRISTTCKDFVDVVTWEQNPNAKLWTLTANPIPTAQEFAWTCMNSQALVLSPSLNYYLLTFEFDVQFRGAQ